MLQVVIFGVAGGLFAASLCRQSGSSGIFVGYIVGGIGLSLVSGFLSAKSVRSIETKDPIDPLDISVEMARDHRSQDIRGSGSSI
jgi:hypothetical protein